MTDDPTPPPWGEEWYRDVSAAWCLARELESLRRLYGPDWPRKSYRLDPKNPRQLTPEEARRLDKARIDYSDIPPLGDEFFSQAKHPTDDPILANPEAVAEIAIRAFARATREAIEENDRLGIPSYGGEDGKITVRLPQAKTAGEQILYILCRDCGGLHIAVAPDEPGGDACFL